MFGIEFYEILIFFQRLGLATAGAAALWGMVFITLANRSKNRAISERWKKISTTMLWIFFPPLFLFLALWSALAVVSCAFCASAHEGISIKQSLEGVAVALQAQYWLYFITLFWGLVGAFLLILKRKTLSRQPNLFIFYGVAFFLLSAFLLFPWGADEPLKRDVSIALHNWHSILTLGTVLVIDFLFTMFGYRFIPQLQRIFPIMTKAIWIGLGLDFLSAGLVFGEEFAASDKILFMQTLVGIVIINGALLSGPIIRAAFSYRKANNSDKLSPRLYRIIGISGVISLVGWLSITALDGFRNITLNYWQLLGVYIAFAAVAYLFRGFFEKTRDSLRLKMNL
jgi:hypothetical protein